MNQPPPYPPVEPPPAYPDWTSVPDTSTLPPPPSVGYLTSPTSNAPEIEAERAQEWCRQYPLYGPRSLSPSELSAIEAGKIQLIKPREYTGDVLFRQPQQSYNEKETAGGIIWLCRTWSGCRDASLMTDLPLYSALHHGSGIINGSTPSRTAYFEVRVLSIGRGEPNSDSSLALGFCAQPYPSWRMPGWERGSLGVHGDDGRRYVNDNGGGKDFTTAFREGEVVGLGMTFSRSSSLPPAYPGGGDYYHQSQMFNGFNGGRKMDIKVFFTRNGKVEGSWDLHEEIDVEDGGVQGLEGDYDIYPAVGVFGAVDCEVVLEKGLLLYRGN
ncbi:MAG: RNA-dependent ATPase rok1 [Watsoniomyces obsoletus]|nr:MAG: RNA-dependent ATPase rok1 [Watsoniomyces obsoletus]